MTPFYFGDGLFGWLHAAKDPSSVGLVIVSPFGYEAICAHRSLRHFAAASAKAGVPAIRFDLHGTGNSAGSDRDPQRVDAWLKSIHQAADALKKHCGVERVVFLGVRLGATLATVAATNRDDCDGVIAIAPVISGRAYLRELKALQMALGLKDPPADAAKEDNAQEAIGFLISAETKEALSKIDLLKQEKAPPSVLILDREDLPTGEKWASQLAQLGAKVERKLVPGYVEMVLDPHKAVVPEKIISSFIDWLPKKSGSAKSLETPPSSFQMEGIEERAITLQNGMFGVYSTPLAPKGNRRGILLLNSGGIHHVGPNRLYVALARRWARLGHAVLRLDICGIGDSLPRPGEDENVVYSLHALDDVRAAVVWLRSQSGVARVDALGLCSGAYHAFKGAVGGMPLDGILCINPLTFFFKPGMPLDFAAFKVIYEAQHYSERARDPNAWKKLLTGKVKMGRLLSVLGARARDLAEGRAREIARRFRIPLKEDLAQELDTIARNGTRVRFLFAGGEPGLDLLRNGAGSTVDRLRKNGKLTIDIIDGPDHTFTPLWSHERIVAALGAHYDR